MSLVPLDRWRCGECGVAHKFEDDAHECCRPSVFQVYECPICGECHDDLAAANICIDECQKNLDGRLHMASVTELESQGQERLF